MYVLQKHTHTHITKHDTVTILIFNVRYISGVYKPFCPIHSRPPGFWCRQDTGNRDSDVASAILTYFLSSGDRLTYKTVTWFTWQSHFQAFPWYKFDIYYNNWRLHDDNKCYFRWSESWILKVKLQSLQHRLPFISFGNHSTSRIFFFHPYQPFILPCQHIFITTYNKNVSLFLSILLLRNVKFSVSSRVLLYFGGRFRNVVAI